ncbi:flagellar hook-basal body complex protein FliE [Tianweitania sediminis]
MIGGLDSLIGIGKTAGAKLDFSAGVAPVAAPKAGEPTSFAAALGDMATNTIGSLQQAEQVSLMALQGDADTRTVVDAVMSAEQSMQAAIAIRDKIVTAYLEISRMAI